MKHLMILFASVAILSSCGESAETKRMKAELDSLRNANVDEKAHADGYIADLNEVLANLEEVNRKEGQISDNTNTNGELTEDVKTRIQNNIADIQALMDENKAKMDALNSKIKKSNGKMKDFEKTIASMQKLIEEKEVEITALREQLASLNIKLDNVTRQYDSLGVENAGNKATIEQQGNEMNTVYYAMGTFKELTSNKVLDKGGAFSVKAGAKLSAEVNQDYFTKADARNLTEISVGSKKASLKTTHPSGSYRFDGGKNSIDKLVITDSQKFWSQSKYCVIVLN